MKNRLNWLVTFFLVTTIILGFVGCKEPPAPDLTAPADVTNFTVTAKDGDAFLSWTNPTDTDFAGLEISMTPAEGTLANSVKIGKNITSFTVSNLKISEDYSFTIKAFDSNNNFSKGITVSKVVEDTADYIPPSNVTNLTALNKDASVLLIWEDATEEDVFGYEVTWNKAAPINRNVTMTENSIMIAPGLEGCYINNLENGTEYEFTVKSIDSNGNESEGVSVEITPTIINKERLEITLSANTEEETNQDVEISVDVKTDSASNVLKIFYIDDIAFSIEDVLEYGTEITESKKIIAKENAIFTVIAIDTAGRADLKYISVLNIDKEAPGEVEGLEYIYSRDSKTLDISWNIPVDNDFYGIEVSYGIKNSEEKTIRNLDNYTYSVVLENIEDIDEEFVVSFKTKDFVGNLSEGKEIVFVPANAMKLSLILEYSKNSTYKEVDTFELGFTLGDSFYSIVGDFEIPENSTFEGRNYLYHGLFDSNGEFLAINDNTILEQDTELHLRYTPEMPNVVFDLNGGNIDGITTTIKKSLNSNDEIKLDDNPVQDGKVFLGWTLTKDGNDYIEFAIEDTTVYAKWEDPKQCSLTFYSEYGFRDFYTGKIFEQKTFTFNFTSGNTLFDVVNSLEFSLRPNFYENDDGKFFATPNEYVDANGNFIDKEYAKECILLSDFTMTAKYFECPIVSFDLNGGKVNGYDETVIEGPVMPCYPLTENCPTPKKEGYIFEGWTVTKDGNDIIDYITEGITTVYAKWAEPKPCTLTVDAGKGYFTDKQNYYIGSTYQIEFMTGEDLYSIRDRLFDEVSVNGYKDTDGKMYHYDYDVFKDENGNTIYGYEELIKDTTLVLQYELDPYVTFNLNGGNIDGNTDTVITQIREGYWFEDEFEKPVRDGYAFLGWTDSLDGYNFVEYTFEDTTVYAKWTPVTTVTIIAEGPIYDYYNGKYLESPFKITFPIGESHSLEYLLEGIDFYDFVIDNTLHSYSEVFLDEEDNIFTLDSIIDSDITLTVKYVLPLNITFDGNGGKVKDEIPDITYDIISGTKLIDLKDYPYELDPYREGYSFVGWTETPDGDDFVTIVYKDMTVYAKWQDPLKLFEQGDCLGDFSVNYDAETGTSVYDETNPLSLTYEGNGIYSVTFTYKDYMNGWGNYDGTCAFKIRTGGDWNLPSYGIADTNNQPQLDGEEVPCADVENNDIKVNNLVDGTSYKIIVRCEEDGDVFVKVETVTE